MNMRKIAAIVLTIAALIACKGESSGQSAARTVRLAFGGNNSATSSYVIAVSYGEIINTNVPGVTMTVEETGGGFEVIGQLINGELDGCTSSDIASYAAIHHTGQFENVPNSDNFYAWLPVYISPVQAIVKANSPIKSYADFAGKRVAIDLVGTGSEQIHRGMFDAFGLSNSITMLNVSKNEGMEMLKTGEVDVSMITTAAPTTVVVEFGTTEKYRIIDLTPAEIKATIDRMGFLVPYDMPGSTYEQMTADAKTIGMYTNAYISKNLDEQLVYDITQAIWENIGRVKSSHPSQQLLSPDMLRQVQLVNEFHPGAARYYREQKWID
jgi:TRAP transporter TAXI family solute receptor